MMLILTWIDKNFSFFVSIPRFKCAGILMELWYKRTLGGRAIKTVIQVFLSIVKVWRYIDQLFSDPITLTIFIPLFVDVCCVFVSDMFCIVRLDLTNRRSYSCHSSPKVIKHCTIIDNFCIVGVMIISNPYDVFRW